MDKYEFGFLAIASVILGLILGVALPSCLDGQRKAVLKCLEQRPTASAVDCRNAMPQ